MTAANGGESEKKQTRRSIGRRQTPHGELDLVAFQLPPAFHFRPVSGLWIFLEPFFRLGAGFGPRHAKSLAHEHAAFLVFGHAAIAVAAVRGDPAFQAFKRWRSGKFRHANTSDPQKIVRDCALGESKSHPQPMAITFCWDVISMRKTATHF